MTRKADRLIQGLIKTQPAELCPTCDARAEARRPAAKHAPIVVTISRGFGTMGSDIAHQLAKSLNLSCCDSSILREVAQRADVDESLVRALDEHVGIIDIYDDESGDHWWQRLIKRYSFSHVEYQEYLAKTVLSIALHGGVILGRGANFLLGSDQAFRVRIVGSPAICSKRVARREGIDLHDAADKVRVIDSERSLYIHKLYDADINLPVFYDLTINTDYFGCNQVVELILQALEITGYTLPMGAFDRNAQPPGR